MLALNVQLLLLPAAVGENLYQLISSSMVLGVL